MDREPLNFFTAKVFPKNFRKRTFFGKNRDEAKDEAEADAAASEVDADFKLHQKRPRDVLNVKGS